MALGLYDLKTKEARLVLKGLDESISEFFWKGNSRLVFLADVSGNESFFIGATDLSGKKVLRIAESQFREGNLVGSSAGLLDELKDDPDHVAVAGVFLSVDTETATFANPEGVIARVNIKNKAISPLMTYKEGERVLFPIVDHAGRLRVRARLQQKTLYWEYRESDDKPWKPIARHPFHGYAETWQPLFFGADNRTLYLISRENQDRGALYAMDTSTMELGSPLFSPPEGEIVNVIPSYDFAKIYGVAYQGERVKYEWLDLEEKKTQGQCRRGFSGIRYSDCQHVAKRAGAGGLRFVRS